MKVEYKNDSIVKSLLDAGFSEDYIEKAIASGDIKIEKSEDKAAAGDHESETKQEKDIDKLEKEAVKKEEKVKKDEKDTAEDKDAEGFKKSEDKDKEDMMKSIVSDVMKSFGSAIAPLMEGMQRSLDSVNAKLDRIGNTAPPFRSEGLDNLQALEKSMSFSKGEDNKYEVNIVTQRKAATAAIEKAFGNDDNISKSLQDEAIAFMANPYAESVGEDLARYMYTKGVKFVK